MIKKVFGTSLLLISISSHADCIKQYNKAIFELNASSASSTTAVPLLSSTAAASGYYAPISSSTTVAGALGSVPLSSTTSTVSSIQSEALEKAKKVIKESELAFGKTLSEMTDEIRIALNDFRITELEIADIIARGNGFKEFCKPGKALATYPAIRTFVINSLVK